MESTKKAAGKIMIGVIVLVTVIAAFVIIYNVFGAKPVEGSKEISIEVVDNDENRTVYVLKTDTEYLFEAMEEADGLTFSGKDSEYGMNVDTVNGVTADMDEGAYWAFYVNGEYCNYGIDSQPVLDGDNFVIEYTIFTP